MVPSPHIYELCVPHVGICLAWLTTLIMIDIMGHTDNEESTLYIIIIVGAYHLPPHALYHWRSNLETNDDMSFKSCLFSTHKVRLCLCRVHVLLWRHQAHFPITYPFGQSDHSKSNYTYMKEMLACQLLMFSPLIFGIRK